MNEIKFGDYLRKIKRAVIDVGKELIDYYVDKVK